MRDSVLPSGTQRLRGLQKSVSRRYYYRRCPARTAGRGTSKKIAWLDWRVKSAMKSKIRELLRGFSGGCGFDYCFLLKRGIDWCMTRIEIRLPSFPRRTKFKYIFWSKNAYKTNFQSSHQHKNLSFSKKYIKYFFLNIWRLFSFLKLWVSIKLVIIIY